MKKSGIEDKNITVFAEMMIRKMESMTLDWKQPWLNSTCAALPENLSGRAYSGWNSLMLLMLQEEKKYTTPVYMTFKQAADEGVSVKKGETSFPVHFWNFSVKDKESGERITIEEYRKLPESERERYKVIPYMKYFNVFNVEQTTLPETKPEQWEKIKERFNIGKLTDNAAKAACPELDYMLENNTWLCPINVVKSNNAFYSVSKDSITVPLKEQYKDGEEFYSTLLHEMAHSTGAENRLDRKMHNTFGDKDYAREELVAELTAALSLNVMGLTSTIQDSNVAYLQSWIDTLKEQPQFIMTILGDVSKAANMIQETVCNEEVKEKIKENTIKDIGEFIEKRNEENARRIPSYSELEHFSVKEAVARKAAGNNTDGTDRLSYDTLRKRFPDAVLLFRNTGSDVYEVFNEDAIKCSELLGIVRTNRDFGKERKIPYASFPAEKLDTYLPKLVRSGERVAICDLPPAELKKEETAEKKLHSAYLGNGISFWEEGDLEYKGHISEERKVTLYGEFTPGNKEKIEETARKGNLLVDNGTLALEPLNAPSKINMNPVTGEEQRFSVEMIDGKSYVCSGRSVISDEPEKFMDMVEYEKNGKMADEQDEKQAETVKETENQRHYLDQHGSEEQLWAKNVEEQIQTMRGFWHSVDEKPQWLTEEQLEDYATRMLQEKADREAAKHQKTDISNSKTDMDMEEKNEQKKEVKDGINVYKMDNGKYGVYFVENGVRSKTRQISDEDTKQYFEGLKGQGIDEVNRRREKLKSLYFPKPLPKIAPEVKERITDASVYKMQDGKNYGVRCKIDGVQMTGTRVRPEHTRAFFEGFKEMSAEDKDMRKAELAAKYFKNELDGQQQEVKKGISR